MVLEGKITRFHLLSTWFTMVDVGLDHRAEAVSVSFSAVQLLQGGGCNALLAS